MTNKARLTTLASQLTQNPKSAEPELQTVREVSPVPAVRETRALIANRPHGDKGDHIKITVTLPPEVYALIAQEVTRRKMAKEPNPQLSAIIREAVVAHFS
jgi:hypothetical protein